MKLFILLMLTLGCAHVTYTQDHATAIVGSVFEGVGNILKTIGIGPQPQAPSQTQSQGSLSGLIQLVINFFTGLFKGGTKPNIASSIPAFPTDNTPYFPGGSGSFPTSSGSASSVSTPKPSSDLSDFPGADDFLNS